MKIVYTDFGNLQKTASMDVGQVGFKSEKRVNGFIRQSSEFIVGKEKIPGECREK